MGDFSPDYNPYGEIQTDYANYGVVQEGDLSGVRDYPAPTYPRVDPRCTREGFATKRSRFAAAQAPALAHLRATLASAEEGSAPAIVSGASPVVDPGLLRDRKGALDGIGMTREGFAAFAIPPDILVFAFIVLIVMALVTGVDILVERAVTRALAAPRTAT